MKIEKHFPILITALLTVYLACFGKEDGTEILSKVDNATYSKNCGVCHFVYQPGLLPARLWEKILDTQEGHAGGPLTFDKNQKSEIKNYLTQNSAEKSTWKKSKKLLSSTFSETPVRISEISYIKSKHWKIREKTFAKESIGTRGNCIACHRSANSGLYDEDDVIIPD